MIFDHSESISYIFKTENALKFCETFVRSIYNFSVTEKITIQIKIQIFFRKSVLAYNQIESANANPFQLLLNI